MLRHASVFDCAEVLFACIHGCDAPSLS